MERLLAEWLAERARFMGSLIGLTDAQFNSETAPGQWTSRVIPNTSSPGTELAEDDCRGPGGKSGRVSKISLTAQARSFFHRT
jgi:hypothetical protein